MRKAGGKNHFLDALEVYLRAGDGGGGGVHFLRQKYAPKGGPSGGDGGRGGHIYLKGDPRLRTLWHMRHQRHITAGHGGKGGRKAQSGASGSDRTIRLPLGTVVRCAQTKQILAEMLVEEEKNLFLRGGRGGCGNAHFKSAVRQAPRYAQPGTLGAERKVMLELKLLADVGLVGHPNAGKSTLLSVLSSAKPLIADYPFSTVQPQLGVVSYKDENVFVMADIPGLVRGAAEGKGLGLRFLRHVERNRVLIFAIPADTPSVAEEYRTLLTELRKHNPQLLEKERVVAITKCDLCALAMKEHRHEGISTPGKTTPVVFVSSLGRLGMESLKDAVWRALSRTPGSQSDSTG